jgi:hypothetical protein
MRKTSLSKSTFIRGQQCEKSLYLYKHHYDWQNKISVAQQAVFDQGTTVGELAQQLFPGGVDCTPDNFYQSKKAVEHTRKEIEAGSAIIYEAAFEFNEILVYADILIKDVEGWKVYEVKSSTSVKEVHIQDAALQGYVLNNSGIELMDISIVHINNQYVKNGSLDIHQLFHVQSIYDEVSNILSTIPGQVERFKLMLKGSEIPEVAISSHCNEPYDCSFKGHCTKHIPKDSVFSLANLWLTKKFDLYNQGIVRLVNIPDDYKLSEKQAMQVEGVKNGTTYINKEEIKVFVNELAYPLYFLDFETINPAVPICDLTRPYEAMVFQYSLYLQEKPDDECSHYEYLAKTDGSDPRISFMDQLIKECGTSGDILVYNIGFERGKLEKLVEIFPEHAALGYLTPVEFLLKYGKLTPLNQSQFPTLQQDKNTNSEWYSLVLNVAS